MDRIMDLCDVSLRSYWHVQGDNEITKFSVNTAVSMCPLQ